MNNFIKKTKNITPYTAKILTSDNYIKTDKLITNSGMIIYGNSSNITFIADDSVIICKTGPSLQLYGKGGENANVGINLDTYQSQNILNNGTNSRFHRILNTHLCLNNNQMLLSIFLQQVLEQT